MMKIIDDLTVHENSWSKWIRPYPSIKAPLGDDLIRPQPNRITAAPETKD